jgi:hypothetical protein
MTSFGAAWVARLRMCFSAPSVRANETKGATEVVHSALGEAERGEVAMEELQRAGGGSHRAGLAFRRDTQ